MDKIIIHLFVFATLLYLASSQKCSLPVQSKKVDFNMLPGRWYKILTVNDAVEKVFHCFSLRDFLAVGRDAYYTFEEIHYQEDEAKVKHSYSRLHMFQTTTSSYRLDLDIKKTEDEKASKLYKRIKSSEEDIKSSTIERAVVFNGRFSYITDYENYLIEFFCGPNDQSYFWVLSRDPNPSAKDLLRIHNKLREIGNGWDEIPLISSECTDINRIEKLPPF